MKSLLLTISAAVLASGLFAQSIDRSKPPKPGPAPKIVINKPFITTLSNGMTLLVVENHKLPRVNATLSIDRGPVYEGAKAGGISLMGQMMNEGTLRTPKAEFDRNIDQMGANVSLFSSGGAVSALTRYFDKAFALMAEALKEPAFPQESFEKIKSQTLTGLKSNEKSASAISGRVVRAVAYGKNTAMGEFETEESIKGLTLDDIKKAYRENITPSRSYLTFVGDITPEAAKKLAETHFGSWKGVALNVPEVANMPNPATTEIDFVDLPTAVQAEISVTNLLSNPMNGSDYHALVLANRILGGGAESKLFLNLREKHGFTYGSYSNTGSGRFQSQFSAGAQVRSEKADSAVAEIIAEIRNMQEGNITAEEINNAKAKINGSFALGMEDPANTATYATNILINKLPADFYEVYLQKINAVTVKDIQRVSKKHFSKDNSRIFIVGNGSKILPNLPRLSYPVRKYDKYANPLVDKPKEINLKESDKNTESVSAASIIDSYLKAAGGKEELKKVNSLRQSFSMDLMGRTFEGVDLKMSPNKRYTEISMGEMKVMQQAFDGTRGYRAQMGQKKPMDEKEVKESGDDKHIFAQLFYVANDHTLSYLGTETVAGEETYKLKVTKPSGKVTVEYYSTKTGLLLREESTATQEGQEFTAITDYADYRKTGNLMLPYKITQTMGEQEFSMNVKEVKLNEGVTENDFK